MAKKKAVAKRTGKKAGRQSTVRAVSAAAPLPRSDKQIADALWARMKKTPDLWERVSRRIHTLREKNPPRVAQAEPRQSATTH